MDLIYFAIKTDFYTALLKSEANVLINIKTPSFGITMCVWAFLVSGTQFMLQVSDKFGPGILWKFITGKYYHPRDEERIFMFLDLKSSTTIAERIGSQKYFNLLREIFNDITEPIINSQGEIYQYVGDEVVVRGRLKKDFQETIAYYASTGYNRSLKKEGNYYLKSIILYLHSKPAYMLVKRLLVK